MILLALGVALLAPAWTDQAVIRTLKGAERAAIEDHDVTRLFARFAKDGRWITGRRAVADAHDVQFDVRTAQQVMRVKLDGPPGRSRLAFVDASAELAAEPPTVSLTLSHDDMGRRLLSTVRYVLRQTRGGWQIVERRQWPLEARGGLAPSIFNDAFWLDADARVDQPGTDTGLERLDALLAARRIAEAAALVERLMQQPDPPRQVWTARARIAWLLGRLDVARAAALAARKHGADAGVPSALR